MLCGFIRPGILPRQHLPQLSMRAVTSIGFPVIFLRRGSEVGEDELLSKKDCKGFILFSFLLLMFIQMT